MNHCGVVFLVVSIIELDCAKPSHVGSHKPLTRECLVPIGMKDDSR
jgi:hypothetical protein